MWNCVKLLLGKYQDNHVMFSLSFGLFMRWIILIDILILNSFYIPGKSPAWPWGFSFNKLLGFDCQFLLFFTSIYIKEVGL